MGVSSGELEIGDNWQTKSKQWVWPCFDRSLWINLDSDVLLKQNCHTQNMKRTIIYGAKFNLSSSFLNHTVSVTTVLMVMLLLVRMLLFRTLLKRSIVHNNGDVNVRNDVRRSRNFVNILTSTTNHIDNFTHPQWQFTPGWQLRRLRTGTS
jgi:hypothetical protein